MANVRPERSTTGGSRERPTARLRPSRYRISDAVGCGHIRGGSREPPAKIFPGVSSFFSPILLQGLVPRKSGSPPSSGSQHLLPLRHYPFRSEHFVKGLRFQSTIRTLIYQAHRDRVVKSFFQFPVIPGIHHPGFQNSQIETGPHRINRSLQEPVQTELTFLFRARSARTRDLDDCRPHLINISAIDRRFVRSADRPVFPDATRAHPSDALQIVGFVPEIVMAYWMNADGLAGTTMIFRIRNAISGQTSISKFNWSLDTRTIDR